MSYKYGELLETNELIKDAVHVAVVSVLAKEAILFPGQRVVVEVEYDDERRQSFNAVPSNEAPSVGIIDPFLKAPVQIGQRCLMFLHPDTTKNLRHTWDHPAFPESVPAEYDYDDGCRGCY